MDLPVLPLAFEPSMAQLLIILLIALLFFGHKLPSVARSLGSSVSEFKKGVKEGENEANAPPAAPVAPPAAAPTEKK